MEEKNEGKRKKTRLKKELTFAQLIMIGVVGSLGNGALFGTIDMVSQAGPGAILAFVFGAVIYLLLGLTYMELARVYPEAGGPTRYTIYTHGRWTNIINAMADIVWYLFIPPVEVIAILLGLNFFQPGIHNVCRFSNIYRSTGRSSIASGICAIQLFRCKAVR